MFIVGLTGGIGSGKSTVARMFEQQGIVTIDADDVAREVVEPGEPALEKIFEHFGDALRDEDGRLNRAVLRERIFQDASERQWLETLLHPIIRDRITQHLENAASDYALLVSPLLLETDQHQLCQRIAVVDVPESVQIERTMARDSNDRAQVERIMAAQMPREKRLAGADDVIDNNQPESQVKAQVLELHQQYLGLARHKSQGTSQQTPDR